MAEALQVLKPGIKTSEFLVTVLTVVAFAAAAASKILDPKYAAILSTISTGIYTITRGWVKQ